jgi:hypothetical protein
MAGTPGLSKDAMAGLQQSLAGQSAPSNPATPKDRTDPTEATLLDLQRIRKACALAMEHLAEGDPRELLVGGINACMTRLLSRIELSDAVDILLERLFPLSSPALKQRLTAMFAPISPPNGLGGGAQGASPNGGPAGGITGPTPGAPPGVPSGDAGPLPA